MVLTSLTTYNETLTAILNGTRLFRALLVNKILLATIWQRQKNIQTPKLFNRPDQNRKLVLYSSERGFGFSG